MLDYKQEFDAWRAGHLPSRPNPFKRDEKGNIRSPLGISALVQSDPDLARRFCAQAGEDWRHWFPTNPK